jgi:hypothetical protein
VLQKKRSNVKNKNHNILQDDLFTDLCTGTFISVCYSFLLISNKFCNLSLLIGWEGGGSAVRKTYCTVLAHSSKAELWALEAHVHKIAYGPLIDTALYVMLLMQANPLPYLGKWEGVGPGNLDFFGAQMALA